MAATRFSEPIQPREGKRSAQLLTKARILLKADVSELGEGWSDSRIPKGTPTATTVSGVVPWWFPDRTSKWNAENCTY
jgi:hypothetical protein